MAVNIAARNIGERAINNLHRYILIPVFMELDIANLDDRLVYLENNWADYRAAHIAVLSDENVAPEQLQEDSFDETEIMYFDIRRAIRVRIAQLQAEQENAYYRREVLSPANPLNDLDNQVGSPEEANDNQEHANEANELGENVQRLPRV